MSKKHDQPLVHRPFFCASMIQFRKGLAAQKKPKRRRPSRGRRKDTMQNQTNKTSTPNPKAAPKGNDQLSEDALNNITESITERVSSAVADQVLASESRLKAHVRETVENTIGDTVDQRIAQAAGDADFVEHVQETAAKRTFFRRIGHWIDQKKVGAYARDGFFLAGAAGGVFYGASAIVNLAKGRPDKAAKNLADAASGKVPGVEDGVDAAADLLS